MTVTVKDIQKARENIKGKVKYSPMEYSKTLSEITGAEVWIKFENFQFTAAFKERGALNKLLSLTEEEKKHGVIAMSAGNHAQGVAYHAAQLGIPATIVMPEGTPFTKIEHTRRHGARVIIHGRNLVEASNFAHKTCDEEDLIFVHPYDDELIIAGQGTLGFEMLETVPELETLVIPVGGGGLISGIAIAAKHLKPEIEIIGVEPAMYPSMNAALRQLKDVKCEGQTIAEGIAVKEVGEITKEICREFVREVVEVGESELEQAVNLFCNVEKTIAEGAGAAGLAALLSYPEKFKGKKVGLVLSGGNIDPRLLASVLTRSLVREQRIVRMRVIGDDRPGLLGVVSNIIGSSGGNIIEVAHNRLALDVPAKGAEFDIMVESRDAQHTQEIIVALTEAGYPPRAST